MSPECTIHIYINIAFSYNDSEISQNQIDAWVKEIEDTWNGPDGHQTYGDCGCKVKFQVNTMKVTDPAQINCTPGPPSYHCIMVTDHNKNQPKNQAGNETYRGYMYGVSRNGSSTNGWWSNEMGEPHPDSPTGQNALDAAHEAGHMLGLGDDYEKGPPERHGNNIMGTTHGEDAKPTQDQIDQVVENVCPDDCCPDTCCCGNGVVEDDKGETCDPLADPNGCGGYENLYCCRICCQCHQKQCMPELGSYASEGDCKSACKDGTCYLNYNTGCWDCIDTKLVPHNLPSSTTFAPPKDNAIGMVIGLGMIISLMVVWMGGYLKSTTVAMTGKVVTIILFVLAVVISMQPAPVRTHVPEEPVPLVPLLQAPTLEPNPLPFDTEEAILRVWECNGVTLQNCNAACQTDCYKNWNTGCWDCPVLHAAVNITRQNQTPVVENITHVTPPTITCGDRKCSVTENCSTCQTDCGRCPYCGDNKCLGGETCSSCKKDCGACPPVCGDGDCEGDEDCESCEDDCGECEEGPECGDGICEGDEDCDNCDGDCGECDEGPGCGNGMCEVGENCECSDCGCPVGLYCNPEFPDADQMGCSHFGGAACGNGLCDETEYCYTCPIDCKCGPETCCLPSNPDMGCGACTVG